MRTLVLLTITLGVCFGVNLPQNPDPNPKPLSWWQEEIIYQVYPRSHKDSDGDGIGDLKGIESTLDHFVDLGIGAVWLSPIYKSPMSDFGYDISDFKDIEPTFGTMADFESLSKAMKERGIKLIMDFVPNHSSDKHEWFEKSIKKEGKYADYYVWRDANGVNETTGEKIPPNNWNSVFGGSAWLWMEERQQFYLHQFTPGQPDLNFENHDVIVEMLSIMKFWMDKGVDGFRVDATPHMFEDQKFLNEPKNPNAVGALPTDHWYLQHIYTYDLPGCYDVLAEMRALVDIYTLTDGVERVMFVEATNPTLDSLFKWYGTKERPIAHFPFNFEFINRIRNGFKGGDVDDMVNEWFCKMPEGNWPNWLMGNHDNHRVASRFGSWVVDPFNMLLLLLPGNAVTYYGEEIGMSDAKISWEDTVDPPACAAGPERFEQLSRDPERTPMQWNGDEKNAGFSTGDKTWLPMHPDWQTVNVKAQKESAELTHLKVYKETAKLRHSDVWRYGSMESRAIAMSSMYGFARIYKTKGFVYLGNFGNVSRLLDVTQEFGSMPDTGTVYITSAGYEPALEVGQVVDLKSLTIGAYHSIVVQIDVVEQTTTTPAPTTNTAPDGTTEQGGTQSTGPGDGGTQSTAPGDGGTQSTASGGGGTQSTTPGGGGSSNSGSTMILFNAIFLMALVTLVYAV